MKKLSCFLLALLLTITPLLGGIALPIAAAEETSAETDTDDTIVGKYVQEGLVSLYSGSSNTREGYKADATAWEDLVGQNDIPITQNATNYFTEEGFHNDSKQYYFPKAIVNLINGNEFTVEMYLGDIVSKGTTYNTYLNSSNDNFALYYMISDDTLYWKAAGNAQADRAQAAEAMGLLKNSLITVTYQVGGKATIYSNGVKVAEANAAKAMGITDFFFGHANAAKNFETTYRSLRFYDRVLTAEEVAANVQADGILTEDRQLSPGYVSIAQPTTNIVGDVALVRRVESAAELTEVLTGEVKPAAVILTINKDLDILDASGAAFATLSSVLKDLNYTILPAFELTDQDTIEPLVEYLAAIRFSDCFFMSKDTELVKAARQARPTARGIIDYTETYKDKDGLTTEECLELRKSMKSNEGTVALLPQCAARRETVQYLYDSIVNVWVQQDETGVAGQYDALLSGAIGVVSDDTAGLYAAATALPENTMTRVPLNIGHRGLPNTNPENTIEGALAAYEAGADVIELDVYITKDGHVVVMHDATTGRTCDKDLNVASSTLAELKELYVNKGYENDSEKNTWRIPTLDEFLEAFKGKDCRLFIELKSEDTKLVPAVRDLVNQYDMYDQCAIITFSATHMRLMREQWPEMSVGALCMAGKMTEDNPDADIRGVMSLIGKYNATLNTQNYNFGKTALRSALIRGIGVYPWTLNGNDTNIRYIDYFMWGYSGLTGNSANTMATYTKKLTLSGVKTGDSFEVGASATVTVTATNYKRTDSDVTDTVTITFVEGEELVSLKDGTLTFTGAGDVTFYVTYQNSIRASRTKQITSTQPVTLHVTESETDSATETVTEPVTEPTSEPTSESATEPTSEPVTDPATEVTTDPATAEPASETETDPATATATGGKSGCTASLSCGALLAAFPVAFLLRKRKKDD